MKKNDKWLIVPRPEERMKLVDKFHAMSAHFGVDSTYNIIREEYMWPKLHKDVVRFKRNCKSCIRNDDFPTIDWIFGPFKRIRSDNETALMSETIELLKKSIGLE